MICKYCGHELSDNSKFCIFCGNIIQHPEEMPVKIIQNKPSKKENQYEAYKPKHGVKAAVVPEIGVPEIDIIDVNTTEKEPMQHNVEKLKLIQGFDTSTNELIEPDTEEILNTLTNKEGPIIEEIITEEITTEEPILEPVENVKDKKPEIVYLGNKFNFADNREDKILNILIITFAALAVVLALKTFVF